MFVVIGCVQYNLFSNQQKEGVPNLHHPIAFLLGGG